MLAQLLTTAFQLPLPYKLWKSLRACLYFIPSSPLCNLVYTLHYLYLSFHLYSKLDRFDVVLKFVSNKSFSFWDIKRICYPHFQIYSYFPLYIFPFLNSTFLSYWVYTLSYPKFLFHSDNFLSFSKFSPTIMCLFIYLYI